MTHGRAGGSVCVLASEDSPSQSAELAKALRIPLLPQDEAQGFSFQLIRTPERLELRASDPRAHGAIYADLSDGDVMRRLRAGKRQPLARACGLQHSHAMHLLDATAGLGRDAAVLARLGCRMTLIERSPIIAALLEDALGRVGSTLRSRFELLREDAISYLTSAPHGRHAVVFLDPMYPHRGKSALANKEMRALRALAGDDNDADQLLSAALAHAAQRVVVKRPNWAPPLGGLEPDHQASGNLVRYDVYFTAGRKARGSERRE